MQTKEKTPQDATILLFGGHVLTQTKQTLDKLVKSLAASENADWIKETIAGLPSYWDKLTNKIPEIAGTIPGNLLLADLDSWLRHGLDPDDPRQDDNLPNIMIGPLLVAIQLNQYWQYLKLQRSNKDLPREDDLQANLVLGQREKKPSEKVEVVGFCVGLLGALAVASSSNRHEFEQYGAAAMRMGMMIGALIDAREVWDKGLGKGKSVTYAVAWRDAKEYGDFTRILSSLFPEAYVSVIFDKARASVTTTERTSPSLVRQCRAAGLTIAEIGIEGHIHSPGPDRKRHTNAIIDLCHEEPNLQFADASALALPTYDNHGDGMPISSDRGDMTAMVLSSILMLQCNWYDTFSKILTRRNDAVVVAFGLDRCIPPTLLRRLGPRQQHYQDIEKKNPPLSAVQSTPKQNQQKHPQPQKINPTPSEPLSLGRYSGDTPESINTPGLDPDLDMDSIAVVGMSIKVAGADDLDEFVDMLKSGQSQHELITRDRLQYDMLFRENADADPNRKFYANFVRDSDAFDHKFFKKSPRESQAMDPQSRLCLEGAYQAVEQSGYFNETTTSDSTRDKLHVGVYLGNCGVDYEHNITCNPATAFTATGGLKSFIAGRLSHYFGWTGPSMTFDTACSSSTVAVHTACRNLLSGECSAALCAGVNIITNMLWMQNLAAGSFITSTGQCKPFDDDADGYCRAEGMAFVFLKKLSHAIADGNPILATIRATAVHQNLNITPLFVPNAPSLSHLFTQAIKDAGLEPSHISLVEAHGTGTPVGDPAEYESIRLAVGGPIRDKPLPFGSVKGHIGHTEGASGVIALIKVIMMMRHGFVPPQASFKKLNHAITVRSDDMMEIVTSLRPWTEKHKRALINNYGACGSNACMVIAQPPASLAGRRTRTENNQSSRLPFWITGLDTRSISAFAAKLTSWLQRHTGDDITLEDISFAMHRQSNRALPQSLIFSCESLGELKKKLIQVSSSPSEAKKAIDVTPSKPPVILCFGGQVSAFVGLDRSLHDNVAVLRWHLSECDAAITSAGLESIYQSPDIFSREPLRDTVKLQIMLFAMQYSCAKTWMDCGLAGEISAVVGHSFGEITALCVAGVLTLTDAIKLVAGRAKLVRDAWGPDPGAMMAVEADGKLVQDLVLEANRASDGSISVACYNGPRSFTLAGSIKAIDAVAEVLTGNTQFSSVKSKKLGVTNAFHSGLVDKLVDALGQLGRDLTFCEPTIPVERATENSYTSKLDWTFVPSHMRQPVFFDHAIQRLAKQYPQATFLEAGSSSTITIMAARALAQTSTTPDAYHFQAVSIANNNKSGLDALTDATVALWKRGLRVTFWLHHPKQAQEYAQLLLPPYQFDKSGRHWLKMKSPVDEINKAAEAIVKARGLTLASTEAQKDQQDPRLLDMYSFVGYQGKNKERPRFRIHTESDKYQHFFSGHIIAQTAPICPATLESDLAIEALFSLHPEWKAAGFSPVVRDLINHSPICSNPSRAVYIDFDALDESAELWNMKFLSINAAANNDHQLHVEARLHFRSPTNPSYIQEFAQYERLVSHKRCQALLELGLDDDHDDVDVLRGRNVYRAFKSIVDYPELYRGVRSVVGRGDQSAGIVRMRHQGNTWLDVPLSDSCSQVGGMWVNLMTDIPPGEMYIATGCEASMRSPAVKTITDGQEHGPGLWHVFAQHSRKSDKEYTTDVFVFDAATGIMHEAMLGIQYARVAKDSMRKMLTRLTKDERVLKINKQPSSLPATTTEAPHAVATPAAVSSSQFTDAVKPSKKKRSGKEANPGQRHDITNEVRDLVASVAGLDPSEFTLDTEMAELGIDSLMGMELAREVSIVFKCTIDQDEQMEATTLRKFVVCVSNALARSGNGVGGCEGENGEDQDEPSSDDGEDTDSSLNDVDTDISTPDGRETPTSSAAQTTKVNFNTVSNLTLSRADILESFGEVKMRTDELIREHHLDTYHKVEIAGSNRLCVALVVEAMEKLGMPLRTAAPGQPLERVAFHPQHSRLMSCIYDFLEQDARLINKDLASGKLVRTDIAAPLKSNEDILQELLEVHPGFAVPNRMTYYAGQSLSKVLKGETDGIRVIFGTAEGRQLVQAMYCEHTFNRMNYIQMREVIGHLADRIKNNQPGETLKVLEMGAGTGGTTMVIAPFLASLGIPVEYTFTDLSPSMVANARRVYGKQYPFMKFSVHDIEKPPTDEHRDQHIVLASNAIHATRNLVDSLRNIRQALRPDGFVMILEMTEVVPFVDLVFGLLEGWWLFEDGRKHAVVTAEYWERELHAAGFGHVDWTDGSLPENTFQKVIMAIASGPPEAVRLPKALPSQELSRGDSGSSEAEAEELVATYTKGWATPELNVANGQTISASASGASVVLVTGATGSLGAHLVQQFAEQPNVKTVVCVNRPSSMPVEKRQNDAFSSRGIELSPSSRAKLRILETDTARPQLGLPPQEYQWLVENGTHIVHNAWPMSGTRPIKAFGPQLQALRNLLDLARSMATRDPTNRVRVGFQFVSSIGVVGYSGQQRVLEDRVPWAAVMPGGYTEAKWACERMLDETVHRYPKLFRPMVVRPGQIAGSTKSGFWNPVEHFAFLVKSAQTLRAWPDLDGTLMWLPVDRCARVMVDLLKLEDATLDAFPVYHIDNPVGQPWKAMSPVLAAALDIPPHQIIPFEAWIKRVRRSPLSETENPASRLADFLEYHFPRMSCGGLILDTRKTKEHSDTMAKEGPVSLEVARLYVAAWKKMGFLRG